MQVERYQRVRAHLEEALGLPLEQRLRFVQQACADDPEIASEVLALLEYEKKLVAKTTQSPWAQALVAMNAETSTALTGRRVGRYELVQEIGAGGMGRVFRARRQDAEVEQWVAVKLMRRERIQESLLQRFSHERRILAHLQHPGIAHFIDAGTDDQGTPFVAMELVYGVSIVQHCRAQGLNLRDRLLLFRQVLAAVSYAHRALVIHRDIKPSNVLVTDSGVAKLVDFGVAKPLSDDAERTQTDERMFTPASAAPEQLRGGIVDVTTDVYGLGALLYELLSGAAPFSPIGLSAAEFERRVCMQPPSSMNTAQRAQETRDSTGADMVIPQDLENIVQKALRKESSARYASVEQFDADIERFLQQRPVQASGAGAQYRLRKFVRRNAWQVSFAGLLVVASVAGIALVAQQNRLVRSERDRAQATLAMMSDAFTAADPSGIAGGDATARQMLESSHRSIAPLAKSQPEDYVALATHVAGVQLSLGLIDPASALLGEAVVTAQRTEIDPSLLLRMQVLQTKLAIEKNQLDEAEALIDRWLAPVPSVSATVQYLNGLIALKRNQIDTANAGLRASIDGAMATARDADWVHAHLLLAESLTLEKQFDEALATLDRLMSKIQEELGAEHAQALRAQLARLNVLMAAGQSAQMRSEGLTLLARIRERYGRASALTGRAEFSVASAFLRTKDFGQAAEHMRLASESFEQSLGAEHPRSYRSRFNVGLLLWKTPGRETEADGYFSSALSSATRGLPDNDPTLGYFRLEYADYLQQHGQAVRALEILASDLQRIESVQMTEEDRVDTAQVLFAIYNQTPCNDSSRASSAAPDVAALCSHDPAPGSTCVAARSLACALQPRAR